MAARPSESATGLIYTIGHGNRSLEEFTTLLERSGIECLIDVRAFPASRRHPHFGRSALEHALATAGIEYAWEGASLGGRRRPRPGSPHTALRNASFRAYADHMETEGFRRGIERLLEGARHACVAIMCAERLPWQCHRYMIADYLVARGIEVRHLIDASAARAHRLRDEARSEGDNLIYDGSLQRGLKLD